MSQSIFHLSFVHSPTKVYCMLSIWNGLGQHSWWKIRHASWDIRTEAESMVRYELRETVATCTRPTEVQARQKSQHREGEVGIKSHPYPRSYFQFIPVGRRKFCFLQCSDTEYINQTPGHAEFPYIFGQHIMDSLFLCTFCFFLSFLFNVLF